MKPRERRDEKMALIKPPLGATPRKFWLQSRAKELAAAINAQLSQDAEGRVNLELVIMWSSELHKLLPELDLESTEF